MGPGMGLRQVSISRYSFGWWPSKIIAVLNVVEQLGWSSVGCITGGLALNAVSNDRIGLVPGVIIIAVIGLLFSFVGLRAVLTYEKYAWAIFFVIFMIIFGETAPKADSRTRTEQTGSTLSGSLLTLFAVVYGSSASWSSIVSDFYVQYPPNTSKVKVFLLTSFGIAIPTSIGLIAGACVASTVAINQEWSDEYDKGIGFLLQYILYPRGFAKFLLVILVLSGIGSVCVSTYSGALSIQQFARSFSLVPRFMWTLLLFIGIILIGIAGRDHLLDVLQNFLSLLGYFNTTFFVIVFSEHYFFRDGWNGYHGYDLDAWNTPSKLPVGIAGLLAFIIGVVGSVLGMVETWYTGVLGKLIGEYYGDIGNQLAFIFTLSYIPLRYLEKKYIGR
jgi:NCS1 nucleoside transporter family